MLVACRYDQLAPLDLPRISTLFVETMRAKAQGIAVQDMAPVPLTENLGKVHSLLVQQGCFRNPLAQPRPHLPTPPHPRST